MKEFYQECAVVILVPIRHSWDAIIYDPKVFAHLCHA